MPAKKTATTKKAAPAKKAAAAKKVAPVKKAAAKSAAAVGPIVALPAAQQQHMLFLFFPLQKGALKKVLGHVQNITGPQPAAARAGEGGDPRVTTGVHFFMFYGLPADQTPTPALPVPSFQTAKGKDLLVVLSIYDRDFGPYISAFTSQPIIAAGLDGILGAMDETGIIPNTDPTSAYFITHNGGVAQNTTAFFKLLMRYNFADPTIPAANNFPVNTPTNPKYLLGATFPGLTVGWLLQNYPDAGTLWPLPAPKIKFAPSAPPSRKA
ncbi:MAG: hypothetical protein ACJ754_23020 [Pyrinomonadaceae bacterium]